MQAEYEDLTINADEKFRVTLVNNVVLYVLAYSVVWALHQFVEVSVAQLFDLRGKWDASKITYLMADDEWWRTAVVAVHGGGPLLCLLIALLGYNWYWKRLRARRGLFKLLVLWGALHALNLSLGALLADNLTQSGSWYVASWLFQMGNVPNVIVGILAGVGQVALGYFGGVAFLQAHDSRTVMRYQNRQRMVLNTLVLPYVLGTAIVCLSRWPHLSLGEFFRLLTMLLLVGPMALGCLNELFGSTVRGPKNTRVAWGLLGLTLVLLLLWTWSLTPPVAFGA